MIPEQFVALTRVLPEPMLLVTGEGRILAANPPFTALLGAQGRVLHNRLLTEFVVAPPEQVAAYLNTCARSRSLIFGSLTFQASDGSVVLTRSEGGVVKPWSADTPALILLRFQRQATASREFLLLNNKINELSREIRDRRRAQEEAYRQREHLRITLASIGDAVIVTDARGRISFMNPIAASLTGWNQAEATGMALADVFTIVNEHTRQPVENPVDKVFREGRVVGLANHTILRGKNGTEYPIDDSGAPIRSEDGTIIGVVLVFRDVTERRQLEARQHFLDMVSTLLASSLEFEMTLDRIARVALPSFATICLVELQQPDGTIQLVAAAHADPSKQLLLEQLRQQDLTEPRTNYIYQYVVQTGQPELITNLAPLLASSAARNTPYLELLRTVGAQSLLSVPMLRRGHVIGALTFVTLSPNELYAHDLLFAQEIAHRCAIALDNARLYRGAQEALRLREDFLLVASHELKTPLTSLLGQAELLMRRMAREANGSAPNKHSIKVIVEQAKRLNRMITALLDVSRIETGQLALECRIMNLSGLLQRVVAEIQLTLEKHTVVCDVPEDSLLIDGDELRLEQVFQNLITNAVKYSPKGGSVVVRAEEQGGRATVAVTDEGMGIPPQEIDNVFQRFYRASNAHTQHMSGMGIGLFVVKEIVNLHGGEITVVSAEGVGSTFTVYLPLPTNAA